MEEFKRKEFNVYAEVIGYNLNQSFCFCDKVATLYFDRENDAINFFKSNFKTIPYCVQLSIRYKLFNQYGHFIATSDTIILNRVLEVGEVENKK